MAAAARSCNESKNVTLKAMATEGTNIIEVDLAHDTYWNIMDLYDSGADLEAVKRAFPFRPSAYEDAFDQELYVTSFALAFWEIGALTEEIVRHLKDVIQAGACVKVWTEGCGESEGKARERELHKLLEKVSKPKARIRLRKKSRLLTNLYFKPNDLLAFRLKDNSCRAVICVEVDQYNGHCIYNFVPTTYKSEVEPTIASVKNEEVLGSVIGSGYSQETTKIRQPGIERVWRLYGDNCTFFFGVVKLAVEHKDLVSFKHKFERIGSLEMPEGLKQTGFFRLEETYDALESIFSDLDNRLLGSQYEKYPIAALCDL